MKTPAPIPPKTRAQILNEALRLRNECRQIITDCEHWNSRVRKPHEAVIDPDPDGSLMRIINQVEPLFPRERWCLHIAGPDDIYAAPSLEAAEKRAALANAWFRKQEEGKGENWPHCEASAQAWPYDRKAHARDVAEWETCFLSELEKTGGN